MNHLRPLLFPALIGLVATLTTACASGPFSGSGAMRIEVEVYKGPLSQEPEIQWGELAGYIEEAKRSLIANLNYTLSVVAMKHFQSIEEKQTIAINVDTNKSLKGTSPKSGTPDMYLYFPKAKNSSLQSVEDMDLFNLPWCDNLDPDGLLDKLDYLDCIILRGVALDSLDLIRDVSQLLDKHDRKLRTTAGATNAQDAETVLQEIVAFSSHLRAKGFRWAVSTAPGQSFDVPVRTAVFHFVMSATEFGNQLQARADTLMKQFHSRGHDRRELPLSSHLRETGPTDFVHLYDWLGGSTDALRYNFFEYLMTGHWPTSVDDRVKIIDRLYADHFWSRINTVYASGKGQVSMAFVKDDLGNWNLKNFDNAPGELLDSYMQLGTQLVKKAGQLALAVHTGGGSEAITSIRGLVKEAKEVQDSLQAGPSTTAEARSRLKLLDAETANALRVLVDQHEKMDIDLRKKLEQARDSDKASLQEQLVEHRRKTREEFERTLTIYKQQIDLLDKASGAAASKQMQTAPAKTDK